MQNEQKTHDLLGINEDHELIMILKEIVDSGKSILVLGKEGSGTYTIARSLLNFASNGKGYMHIHNIFENAQINIDDTKTEEEINMIKSFFLHIDSQWIKVDVPTFFGYNKKIISSIYFYILETKKEFNGKKNVYLYEIKGDNLELKTSLL